MAWANTGLKGVLDACLADGFGSVSVASAVVSGGYATIVVTAGHGKSMLSTSAGVGPVLRISGASDSAFNGDWQMTSLDSSTQLKLYCPGVTDGAKSGTMTLKYAPIPGWEKKWTASGVAVYKSADMGNIYLRCAEDASGNFVTQLRSGMTGDSDGTLLVSIGEGKYYQGSSGTAPDWFIIGDSRTLYLGFKRYQGISRNSYFVFPIGEYKKLVPTDTLPYVVGVGQELLDINASSISNKFLINASASLGLTAPIYTRFMGPVSGYVGKNGSTVLFATNNFVWSPLVMSFGDAAAWRPGGVLRGALMPLHNKSVLPADKSGVDVPGGALVVVDAYVEDSAMNYIGKLAFDAVGPW